MGEPPLGWCPVCETPIGAGNPVVTYETAGGWPRMVAECGSCEETVHPV